MSIIAKSWKPFGALLKAPFKGAKWAMSSDRSGWVKWPARGAAAAAVLGTGAAVVSGRSRGTETPPELLQAQQMQMENQEILNNIQMQQAMMQPQMQSMVFFSLFTSHDSWAVESIVVINMGWKN